MKNKDYEEQGEKHPDFPESEDEWKMKENILTPYQEILFRLKDITNYIENLIGNGNNQSLNSPPETPSGNIRNGDLANTKEDISSKENEPCFECGHLKKEHPLRNLAGRILCRDFNKVITDTDTRAITNSKEEQIKKNLQGDYNGM